MSKPKRTRIDKLLVELGYIESRERAQRLILAGQILVDERMIDKPGTLVHTDATVRIVGEEKYVGRGGHKLEAALDFFEMDVTDMVCLDVGASTGGFTDCLLQRGAKKVYAVDVGHGQLDWKLRNDPSVVVLEKINARSLSRDHIPELVDICVIDVSFISLTLILPNAFDDKRHQVAVLARGGIERR